MLARLLSVGLGLRECSVVLGVTSRCLSEWVRKRIGMEWSELEEYYRGHMMASLRSMQYRKAMSGDTRMLTWLGKQYLGQREVGSLSIERELEGMPVERLIEIAKGEGDKR